MAAYSTMQSGSHGIEETLSIGLLNPNLLLEVAWRP